MKGLVIVIGLYMLLNFALVHSTGLAPLAGSELALATALEFIDFPLAGDLIVIAAILILLSHQEFRVHEWLKNFAGTGCRWLGVKAGRQARARR